jgi:hypothetical protein
MIAHQIVVFRARYPSRASTPLGGAPTRTYNAMMTLYPMTNISAEMLPARYDHRASGSAALTVIILQVLRPPYGTSRKQPSTGPYRIAPA